MVAATIITAAFGSDAPPSPGVVVDWLRRGDDTPPATQAGGALLTPLPTETPLAPSTALPPGAAAFTFPVGGACLPQSDDLLPGAPRAYRNGTHEGLDFYDSDNCVPMGIDTEILAAKAGIVIRADWNYQDLTPEELAELEEGVAQEGANDPALLDRFRGRQVWIDHGEGVVTRYAHLNGIAEEVVIGGRVEQGQVIGYMGESGAPESVTEPGTQVHLHFEIRVGAGYLGQGLAADEVRRLYEQAFSS